MSHKGSYFEVGFDEEFINRLNQFSKAEKVNDFLVLLTAYAILLWSYSSQSEINIGVPFTNRRRESHKNIMGCFMNILPICIDLEPGDTFRAVIRKIRTAMLGAHRHQEAPYGTLVKKLVPPREPSYNPIFQVGFTFEHPMQMELGKLKQKK